MSLIFDALQRSAHERFGVDLGAFSTATELLQNVERQKASEWDADPGPQVQAAIESVTDGLPWPLPLVPIDAVVHSGGGNVPPNEKLSDPFGQFKSLESSACPQGQLACLTDSEGLAAEKFRYLAVRLRHLQRERSLKKILVTSTIPREGKSTVAANLACVLARKKQQRTLLIDGDLRRPSLGQIFGLGSIEGLSDWLQGEHSLTSCIYHLNGPEAWILSAGRTASNPLELLQSGKLSELMDQLTALFDWIIIDSPPVLPLGDTSIWMRLADGILLVAREGTTEKRQLQKGLEVLEPKKLIGALLNGSRSVARSSYYYYGVSTSSAGK